jgi:hypothetical protein
MCSLNALGESYKDIYEIICFGKMCKSEIFEELQLV